MVRGYGSGREDYDFNPKFGHVFLSISIDGFNRGATGTEAE